ncbi:hypothetical protein Trihar35433_8445 [Trichoderma harzianum]|nr:hypothetical protein Trihar35433_8445 [Trichoderma harzianum]
MPSDNGASTLRIMALIVGVVVAAVAVIVSIKAAIASFRKKAKAAASSKSGVVAKAKAKETSKADIKKWYKAALDKIVAARLEEESSVESGEPVFLSHYISQGQFRHWVLHTHDYKYELRQTEVGDSNKPGVYEATIGPSGFNLKAYKESVITRYSPEVGHYFYSMIGWTTLSKERIDEECHRISTAFGKYSLLSNNCHDFLQQLADKVVTKKAPDWGWFRQSSLGGYSYLERPALGYQVIGVATWSRHLKRMKHYLSAAEQQSIDDFIALLEDLQCMGRLTAAEGTILTAVEVTNIMIAVEAMDIIMTADTTDIMTPAEDTDIFTSEVTDMEATDTMMVEAADTEADTPVN